MGLGYWATLIEAQVDGTAVTNTTTPTSLLPAAAGYTFGASFFKQIGDKLLVKAAGRISTVVTTPGTLTLDLRYGATTIATSGAMTLSTSAKTNVAWEVEWLLTARAIGATGNFMHQGHFISEAAGATTVAGEAKVILMPQSAPAVGSNVDLTAAAKLDMYATWSVANASNSITLHQFAPISI